MREAWADDVLLFPAVVLTVLHQVSPVLLLVRRRSSSLQLRDRVTDLLFFFKVTVIDVVAIRGNEWLWAEASEHLGHLTLMLNAKPLLFRLCPVIGNGLDLRNFVLGA